MFYLMATNDGKYYMKGNVYKCYEVLKHLEYSYNSNNFELLNNSENCELFQLFEDSNTSLTFLQTINKETFNNNFIIMTENDYHLIMESFLNGEEEIYINLQNKYL